MHQGTGRQVEGHEVLAQHHGAGEVPAHLGEQGGPVGVRWHEVSQCEAGGSASVAILPTSSESVW